MPIYQNNTIPERQNKKKNDLFVSSFEEVKSFNEGKRKRIDQKSKLFAIEFFVIDKWFKFELELNISSDRFDACSKTKTIRKREFNRSRSWFEKDESNLFIELDFNEWNEFGSIVTLKNWPREIVRFFSNFGRNKKNKSDFNREERRTSRIRNSCQHVFFSFLFDRGSKRFSSRWLSLERNVFHSFRDNSNDSNRIFFQIEWVNAVVHVVVAEVDPPRQLKDRQTNRAELQPVQRRCQRPK